MGNKKEITQVSTFAKDDLIKSSIFANRKDVLNALLNDNEKITIEQAFNKIEKFMKGKVN